LPSLRPSNGRRSVAGAFSRPCCTSTLSLILGHSTFPELPRFSHSRAASEYCPVNACPRVYVDRRTKDRGRLSRRKWLCVLRSGLQSSVCCPRRLWQSRSAARLVPPPRCTPVAAAFMAAAAFTAAALAASAVTASRIAASITDLSLAAEALHSWDPRDGVGTAVHIGGR
jgi:hypothetical protein